MRFRIAHDAKIFVVLPTGEFSLLKEEKTDIAVKFATRASRERKILLAFFCSD
jgi:hypothetical protein